MDNLTHSLIGVVLGESGLRRRLGAGTTLALVIGSNLPDLDAAVLPFGPEAFLKRRAWTHSLLLMPVLSLVAAWALRRFAPQLGTARAFGLILGGCLLHVVCDLLNSYGVRPLVPFSHERFELSWMFIVDFFLWAILLAPVLLARGKPYGPGRERIYRVGAVAALAYVLGAGAMHARAVEAMEAAARAQVPPASFTYAFPDAFSPLAFRGVMRTGDRWSMYPVDAVGRTLGTGRSWTTIEADPAVQKLKSLPFVRQLDAFYKAPVWLSTKDGPMVFDLRFVSPRLPARLSHVFTFGPDGSVVGGVTPSVDLDALDTHRPPVAPGH